MSKEEIEKQTAEEMAEQRTANNLMNFIIAKTFSRHANMSEEEYLTDIGFNGSGKTEAEAIRIAKFNVMVELTNQLLSAKHTIKMAHGLIKGYWEEYKNGKSGS